MENATHENIDIFISDFLEGKLKRSKETVGTVVEVTFENFEEIVRESPEDVLVKFYAPWCGHWFL